MCGSMLAGDLHNKRHKAFLAGKKMPKQYAKPFRKVQFFPERLQEAVRTRKPTVFGLSFTGDWMDGQAKLEWSDQAMEIMAACPQHQFVTLTKQAGNLARWYDHTLVLGGGDWLPNVWNGVTVCTQADLWRVEELLKVPGKKWISYEPALEYVDFSPYLKTGRIKGIVVGQNPVPSVGRCRMHGLCIPVMIALPQIPRCMSNNSTSTAASARTQRNGPKN